MAAAFVSSDIVGHSKVRDPDVQLARVSGINQVVRRLIERRSDAEILWASGGDGGHVAFLGDDWQQAALDLMGELRRWATMQDVRLRIVGHYGPVHQIEGADGRVQLVGDGINVAGWILTRGSPQGFVVSEAFMEALGQPPTSGVQFHDPRLLRPESRPPQRLFLMSMSNYGLESAWGIPVQTDRELLRDALERKAAWDVIYYAKRIMEINTNDAQARQAIQEIQRLGDLKLEYQIDIDGEVVTRTNPFLGFLDSRSLLEVIRSGELVERRYNEVICRYGDEGDTMFVILRGQVGVFRLGGVDIGGPDQPTFQHEEGEIVGELAFALKRKRTADLIALSEVALLTFNHDEIERHAKELPSGPGQELRRQVSKHVLARTLEHTCHQVPYLMGRQRAGPLSRVDKPWDAVRDDLLYHTREIKLDRREDVSIEALHRRYGEHVNPEGIYILVGGTLKGPQENSERKLAAEDYPLLYVDLPGDLVGPDQRFRVEDAANMLHIPRDALDELPKRVLEEIVHELKRELRKRYHHDVFISYNSEDRHVAERWRRALEATGLIVYMEAPRFPDRFPERISAEILNSLVMLAFVSAYTVVRLPSKNWVRAEVEFRKAKLKANACILPILLPGGRPEDVTYGYTPIDATKDETACIDEAIQAIRRIRQGESAPPFDLHWHPEARLIEPIG